MSIGSMRPAFRCAFAFAVAGVITLALQSSVKAEDTEQPVNTGKISFEVSADIVTEYWFRGIGQENQGFILQPGAALTINLIDEEDFSLDGYFGTWNSYHDHAATGSNWYESDIFVGLSAGLPHDFGVDLSYIVLYDPANGATFAEEVDLGISYDDSNLMDELGCPVALSPHVLFAIETGSSSDGGSDGGNELGTYMEIGIEPSFIIVESVDYPVTLNIPMTVGLSLDDYYEADTNGDGILEDDTFGFFDVGAVFSMPLAFIPSDYGQWETYAGVHCLLLGDTTEQLSMNMGTGDDDFSVYGTFGISMNY